jgi:hypothetical protein
VQYRSSITNLKTTTSPTTRTLRLLPFILLLNACAAIQPPGAGGPARNEPLYPVVLIEDPHRKEATLLAWKRILREQGVTEDLAPKFQPIIATIESLPENLNVPLHLPKVGVGPSMTEEEVRESLRRFLKEWNPVICADWPQLTLVQREDSPDGKKIARYEQHPSRYPLRGKYGNVEIRFTLDRRILQLSSTCIPQLEGLQNSLNAITPRLKGEELQQKIVGRMFSYFDSTGHQQAYTVAPPNKPEVRELVVYPLLSPTNPDALEFHLAWEVELAGAPVKKIYVDAVRDEVIAVSQDQGPV